MSLAQIAVLLVTIGLVLCAIVATGEPEAAQDYIMVKGTAGGTFSVHEITLKDGTKCAVVMQSRGTGITCNWLK